ncbi:MAG TPA: hypothetical protein VMT20_22825 [Terriglobia bacterium]|nr:hypothetical protein [Terriglobia bacterium]
MPREHQTNRANRDQLSDEELQRIEADPEFQRLIKESIRAEREGRTFTNAQVKEMTRKRRHG